MIDWSAASTVGPARESPDRCWLAWGRHGQPERPPARYHRTRGACIDQVERLLDRHAGSALVGFDFPIGYPRDDQGRAVLPEGRALVEHVAGMITDDPDASNNRFTVAAALNRHIRRHTGRDRGPFWGVPARQASPELTVDKPRDTGVVEYRPIERMLRDRRWNLQSPWKLLGAGSVGSQTLLGLPAVARVLRIAGARGRLWPFEPLDRDDAIVVAEIWPTLGDFAGPRYAHAPIRDARQVLAMRDALMDDPQRQRRELLGLPGDAATGWILGAAPHLARPDSS
jgi:hypothetical protein